MGIYIFLILVIVEMALAVYCIITKSNQKKVRSIIRIVIWIGFLLMTVLSILEWSFRYYALDALLLIFAIISLVSLLRKKQDNKAYKTVRVVRKAVGMIVLVLVFTLPAILFPKYKAMETTGEYQVAAGTYTYTDTNRIETYTNTGENRKLNVKLWYPDHIDGTYPLIVFSHGGFGIKSSNETLYHELASHGYVICSIDHTYQCFYTTDEDGNTISMDKDYRNECLVEDPSSDIQQSYAFYQKWMKIRTGDMDFVIDMILEEAKNKASDAVYRLVDTTKIGVMGHSMGGSAALGLGRTREDVSAVIALEAPFMCDILGVKEGKFIFEDEVYPVPVLNVYSDDGWKLLGNRPQYAQNYKLLSDTQATAFNVYISGTGHLTLTDLALTTPILTQLLNGHKSTTDTQDCLQIINKVSLEFFDCYLKGEGEFTSGGTY